ncbi:MAG: hypothetical protein CVU89_02990 [Firmicutes bacterium HGW-Firmicutes-14]|nr:MAG: hypothetical protein CVU89_02990 [Firmicutes bacterium HGW-Firmicutes-14]
MSDLSVKQQGKVSIPIMIIILVLLAANIVMSILTIRKYVAKEPTVDPQIVQLKNYMEKVNANPTDINNRLQLAYTLQMMNQYDKAREQYTEVLKIEEGNLAANYNLGVMAQAEKKYSEAEEYYKKVLSLKENHVIAAIGLGETYLAQEKYEDIITVADKVLELEPGKTDLHLLKARAYEQQGDTEKAREQYNAVLKYIPDDTEAVEGLKRLK